jgi:hypothetical protein
MRLIRIFAVTALAVAAATGAPAAALAVPTSPYTVVTMSGPLSGGDAGGTVLDPSNSTIAFANATAAGPLQFDATPAGSTEHTVITINPPVAAAWLPPATPPLGRRTPPTPVWTSPSAPAAAAARPAP